MGCKVTKAIDSQTTQNEKESSKNLQTMATCSQLAGKIAQNVPIFGGIAGGCLTCIAIILINLDASQRMPDFLRKCRSKLVHVQALLLNFEDRKLISSGITSDYFNELQVKLEDFRTFIEERLKKNQTESKVQSLINLFSSKSDLDKTEALNVQIDAALQKFLLAKINDDISDQFPDFLKKIYKNKPGYDTWRSLFGNKEQKKTDSFVQRYACHNDLDKESIQKTIVIIDRDKNGSVSFEEFMAFVDTYIYYYDEKGSRIRKIEELLKRIKEDDVILDQVVVTGNQIDYPDSSKYIGDIKDGLKDGKGKLTKGSNYFYEGEFKKDLKHGKGKENKNGNIYDGEWKNNQKNGTGKMVYIDGSVYEGSFKQDLPDSKGLYVTQDCTVYEGIFLDGFMVEGVIRYVNGERYEGQTKETKLRHGRGKIYDASGQLSFEGNFNENVPSQKYNYFCTKDKATIDRCKNDITNIDIDLDSNQGHDYTLLSNLKKLNVLRICFTDQSQVRENKDLAVQLLNNVHPDSVNSLTDLIIIIPGNEYYNVQLSDFPDIFNAISQFQNIINLNLSLPSWGARNPQVDGKIIELLIQCYQKFQKLKYLKLDLFDWAYENPSIKNEEVVSLLKGLEEFEEGQLISFSLDAGRWGCQEYDNYQYFTDFTMGKVGDLIKNQKNLEELYLNIRSWAYFNKQITNMGCQELFDGIAKLKKLKKLYLGLRGLAYNNNIQQPTLESLAKSLSKLSNLEDLTINLEVCENFTSLDSIRNLQSKLPKLQKFLIEE